MGGGTWSSVSYSTIENARSAAGYTSNFTHTEDVALGRRAAGVADALDPKLVNNHGEHAGKNVRECMDSDEHPNATPIAVLFDVTGSMRRIPEVLVGKLPQLHGVLQRKGYVEDPQILFGGIGDAHCDSAPLQVGQFESDNAMDEQLALLYLECGGGGGNHESYELAAYFMARHTHLDSVKNRGRRGYLFFIGDERLYSTVDARQVRSVIGGVSSELAENISTARLFEELKEKWDVYFLFAAQGSYEAGTVIDAGTADGAMGWRELLGQNAIVLDDADAVCETIALAVGLGEGVTFEDGLEDLAEAGADRTAIEAAGRALATVGAGSSAVAESSGDVDLGEGESGSERL